MGDTRAFGFVCAGDVGDVDGDRYGRLDLQRLERCL
jgi:hypothetical protein